MNSPVTGIDSDFPIASACLGEVPRFTDAPDWIYQLDNPYLHGVYAPVLSELQATNLEVEGELPADLSGAYFRNGPNPVYQPKNRYHPFDGDGMVHAVYFNEGTASYRNRYVHTVAWDGERADGQSVSPGVMGPFDYNISEFGIKDTSNTDIFVYSGDVMTLWYNAGHPYRLGAESLETKGYFELEGRQHRRLSAHSKVDWKTVHHGKVCALVCPFVVLQIRFDLHAVRILSSQMVVGRHTRQDTVAIARDGHLGLPDAQYFWLVCLVDGIEQGNWRLVVNHFQVLANGECAQVEVAAYRLAVPSSAVRGNVSKYRDCRGDLPPRHFLSQQHSRHFVIGNRCAIVRQESGKHLLDNGCI